MSVSPERGIFILTFVRASRLRQSLGLSSRNHRESKRLKLPTHATNIKMEYSPPAVNIPGGTTGNTRANRVFILTDRDQKLDRDR